MFCTRNAIIRMVFRIRILVIFPLWSVTALIILAVTIGRTQVGGTGCRDGLRHGGRGGAGLGDPDDRANKLK
jgi:hypothetical protein